MKHIPAIALCAILVACGAQKKDPLAPVGAKGPTTPSMITAAFTCPDASVIYAIFRIDSLGNSTASLAYGDERILLPQVISADGAHYADTTTSLWNKGKSVTLERGGKSQVCKEP